MEGSAEVRRDAPGQNGDRLERVQGSECEA